MKVLGVKITDGSREEIGMQVKQYLCGEGGKKVYTPNPEMLVIAQKDTNFRKVLNDSDVNLCDGFGLYLASWGKLSRWPGVDFVHNLCSWSEEFGKGLFLLGTDSVEVLAGAVKNLQREFPRLNVVGYSTGPQIKIQNGQLQFDQVENQNTLSVIKESGAEVLLVAFGQVKQEKWINDFLPQIPMVKVAVGVGGTIDYIAEKVKRAPVWVRNIGLEWLYRLIQEPWRLKRIFNATILFMYYFLKAIYVR